jgi:hypothetical protein
LALGGGLGFLAAGNTTKERIVERPGPTVTVTVTVPAAASIPERSIAPEALPSVATIAAAPGSAQRHGPDLAKERAMLDIARTALGRSDGASALAAAQSHQASFPRGALREESEAIEVQALVLVHDGRAPARGRQFISKYPKSLYRPAVEAALQGAPE